MSAVSAAPVPSSGPTPPDLPAARRGLTGALRPSRLAAAGSVAAVAVLALALPASAHVTVAPEGVAAKGGYAVIDVKVPNERDGAATTKVEVSLPVATHPLASVSPEPVPGWTIKITKSKLAKPLDSHGKKLDEAVSKITWTAEGKGIEPGYFQKFPLSLGALPTDADSLEFKALQTYDNGEVVRWIESRQEGAEEPENPAPVLALGAPAEAAAGAEKPASAGKAPAKATAAADPADSSDGTARVLGVVGIVVGVAGVAFGVLAGRRRSTT